MGIIIKDRSPLVSFILTEYGKKQLAAGNMSFDFYAFGDSDVDYRTVDINSLTLKPNPSLNDVKFLLYKKDKSCFYPMKESNIELSNSVINNNYEFNIFKNENQIISINDRLIGLGGEVVNVETPYILNVKFDRIPTKDDLVKLDFITLYLSDEFKYAENTFFTILHCQIDNFSITEQTAKIYLKQPVNLELQDYRFFITSSNNLFFDEQSWNQVFCGGQIPSNEKRFDGIRSYFDLKDGALIHRSSQLSATDFDVATNDATLYLPTIIWDKCPSTKTGMGLHTTGPLEPIKSSINQYFNIERVCLVDDYSNPVGVYFPHYKMFFIDDIELATTMANKNGRNWTLPGIDFEYLPSNGNGIFNKTDDDLYVTYRLKGGVHENTAYCRKLLFIPNKKGDYQINLDFSHFNLALLSDQSRRVNEVSILFQFVSPGNNINNSAWQEITMLKGDNLMVENIRAKYGLNIQHLNRGTSYRNESTTNLDEQLFLGNVKYSTQTKRYLTTFKFTTDVNKTIYTSNPTYTNDKEIRVSEVAVYDKSYKVVAYAKVSHSIRWRPDVVFTIKTQMAF
jgi:hypothetical protein